MPKIQLPDGSERQFDEPVTGLDIAASIGKGLARDFGAGGETVTVTTPDSVAYEDPRNGNQVTGGTPVAAMIVSRHEFSSLRTPPSESLVR